MPNYKSQQVADAIARISRDLAPKVTITPQAQTIYGQNTNTPDPTSKYEPILEASRQYHANDTSKSAGKYLRDAGVSLAKGVVAVPQAVAGIVDIADAGMSAAAVALQGGNVADIQTGRFSKGLQDIGVDFKGTQDILNTWHTDEYQKQQQGLAAVDGMSTEKSFGENMSSLGDTLSYVADNPTLAVNTVIESLPSMVGGALLGKAAVKGVGKVAEKSGASEAALARIAALPAGAIGEGAIMAGGAQANMRNESETGYTTAGQTLAATGIGLAGGAIGNLGARFAAKTGALDPDSVFAGMPKPATPNSAIKALASGTATEALEEAAQTSVETLASNYASDKDLLDGYNQDLVLGTLAGGLMGAGTNAPSAAANGALQAVSSMAKAAATKAKEKAVQKAPELGDTPTEEFANPQSENYNPKAAIIRTAKEVTRDATPEQLAEVGTKISEIVTTAETQLAALNDISTNLPKISAFENNIVKIDAMIAQLPEDAPQVAAMQGAKAMMENQIAQLTPYVGKEEELGKAISHVQGLVNEAQDTYKQYAPRLNNAAPKAAAAPTTPHAQVFAAPTAYSVEQIQAVVADPSVPEEAKVGLRVLSEAIVAQNVLKDLDAVNQQVVGKSTDPNYISTPQYLEKLGDAISRGSSAGIKTLMSNIASFETSHVAKAAIVAESLEQVKATGKSLQVVRTAQGEWEVNSGKFLKGEEAKTNGAVTINASPNGIEAMEKTNQYLQAEATAIVATHKAMQAMVSTVAPTATEQAPMAQSDLFTDPNSITDFDAALDSYNQDLRANNEWQPNQRSEDPRSTDVLEEAIAPTITEAAIPAATQPTSGTTPPASTAGVSGESVTPVPTENVGIPDTPPALGDVAFDEQSVGSTSTVATKTTAKSKAKASEATEVSDSEPVVAKAKPSVTKEMAEDILEGKYSEDTHRVYQKEDGNWAVRKKTFDELLDEVSESVEAFEDLEPQVDEEGEKLALESTEVETDDAVKDTSIREEERTKPIEKRDLIKDGFNRRDTPLAKMPDLHKGLKSTERAERAIKYLTDIEPTKEHVDNVLNFSRFREDVANAINGSVKVRRVDNPDYVKYQWQDYLQFLVKDDGTFDDDVITAVAGAAYLYVAENAEVKTKTEKDVAKLLRLKNVDSVPHHIFSKLAEVGDHRNLLRATLGQRASASLGYKQLSDVSEVRTGKLNDALGSLVLRSLTEMGIVEITTMPNSEFEAMRQEIEDDQGARKEKSAGLNDGLTNNFARIVPGDLVTNISKANEKTNSVLSKMLAVKSEFTMPVLDVPTDLIKNSFNDKGTPYPSEAVETTKISQARPYGFMNEMVKVADSLRALDEIEYKRILGFKTENELADMQVMKQLGQMSINDSIDRSLKIVDEFRADLATKPKGVHTPFYLPQFLVSNTRSHYASDLNPQADKIHRGLVGMKEHEVELDTNQAYFTDKGITEMGRFMQAVAMNIEKAPIYKNPLNNEYVTIDKANYKNFIPSMLQYLEQPHVVLAIQAMQNVQKGKGTHSDLTAISAFVKEGGMKMQSLKALQALADFDAAKQYGSKFITDITFESDGVTNGPFLTGISTNTLADDARNAGGLFRDDRLTSVPEYKEGLGQDLYEFLGAVMKKVWADHKKVVNESGKKMVIKAVNALDTLYPVFGERSGAKPITTTANYGAGDTSIKAANAREVINNLINKLDTDDHKKALTFIKAANEIISYTNVAGKFKAEKDAEKAAQDKTGKFKARPYVEVGLISTSANPKSINLSAGQISAIYEFSKNRHGAAIEESLQHGLGDFIPVRNTLTNHASLAFEFFDVLRIDALEAATQRAIEEKTLETVNGKPIESISVKEKNRALREIAKYTPTFTNAMAAVSGNRSQSSTPLMKTEKELLPGNLGKSELHFKDGSQVAHAQISVPANPGVSGLALAVQSMDSFVTHFVMKRLAAQNYHDANASSITQSTKMAQIQNEGVFTALYSMHLNSGMMKAFINTANGAYDLGALDKDSIMPKSVSEVLAKLADISSAEFKDLGDSVFTVIDFTSLLQREVTASYDRDIAKLKELAQEKYVGQYGTQEGHYTVTEADVKKIEKEIRKLKTEKAAQLEEATRLGKALNETYNYTPVAKQADSMLMVMDTNGVKASTLIPKLKSELSQYFSESNTDAQRFSLLFNEILTVAYKAIDPNMLLKGIDVNDPANDKIPQIEMVSKNRISAWFGKDASGKDTIFFAQQAGTPTAKVVVHEIVHAVTVGAIQAIRANPDAYPEGKAALARLDKLLIRVQKEVAHDKDVSDVVKYGVSNLEEFIATGLTYSDFVDYLSKVQVQSGSRSKIKFTSGFSEFIQSVGDVISSFIKTKAFKTRRMITALEALVYDTTELIQGTAESKPNTAQMDIFGAPHTVDSYTAKQVFSALPSNVSPEFQKNLETIMDKMVDTVYAGLEQKLIENPEGLLSPQEAWEEFNNRGKALTTESALTAGFIMSEQEKFAVESIQSATAAVIKDKGMTAAYAELNKAFQTARTKLKPESFHNGDWATADRYEKEKAQDMYDFLFKITPENKEPLARFTAMAAANEQVNNLLGFTTKADAEPNDAFEKILKAVDNVTNYVFGLLTHTSTSQPVKQKVGLLVKELARIDVKNRELAKSRLENNISLVEDKLDDMSNAVRDKVTEFAKKDSLANSRFTAVRLASNTTRLAAQGDLWTTLDTVKEWNQVENSNQRLGFWGELVNEAANNTAAKKMVESLLRKTKLNNQTKEHIRQATKNNVLSTFEENGNYLTKEDKHALTLALRSDIQSLVGTYSTQDIARLYSDSKYLSSETTGLAAQIMAADPKQGQEFLNRAEQLAKYMVTGYGSTGLAKNARLIVSGFNSTALVAESDPRVELVDRIATLYAIGMMDSKNRSALNSVTKRELKNKVNGFDTILKFHKDLASTAKDTLFVNNSVSVIKGFMPEITNPNREVRIATNRAEAKILEDQFFKKVRVLGKDLRDPTSSTPTMYLTEEANNQRIVSGAVELVSTNRKGTSVLMDAKTLAKTIKAVESGIPTKAGYSAMKDREISMIPNYDTNGTVIGFSYEMSAEHRDSLLERNNDFSDLLGAYAATNFNKTTVPAQNEAVIDALYEEYKEGILKNPRAYVKVSPNSNDVGLRQLWVMLPEETRKHAESLFGKGEGIIVHNDVLLMAFGYRKYSLNQAFAKQKEARSTFEHVYVAALKALFNNNAMAYGTKAERVWQESITLMKDIIVIRSVKTLMANLMSNTFLLLAHGVSPSDIIKDTTMSVRAGIQYRKDSSLLLAAQQKLRAGVGDAKALEQEILRLEDSISRNPLLSFINEGMLPTIVEDIEPDANHYSYKSKAAKSIESYTDQIPKSVRTAAKWAMVSPDTPAYTFLNNATQFSDFSSKYVMYKHYTQAAKEKLSHEEALQIASDNFINYDVPTGRGLQYANDMGIVMFTKYNIRIQKALFHLLKKRPAAAMAQAILINSFTNLEAGTDPLVWFNMGNPLREGAFGLPSSLDDPFPIQALTGMF